MTIQFRDDIVEEDWRVLREVLCSFAVTSCVASSLKSYIYHYSQQAKLPEVNWSNPLLAKSPECVYRKQSLV